MDRITTTPLSRRAILGGGAAMGAGAALGLPSAAWAQPAGEWPAVKAFIEEYVRTRKVANMVAALGWGQDAPTYLARGNTSFISQRKADRDSIYRIYSMTKPVTGMAAMMLVDEGRIALDQPVSDFLPAFAQMQVQIVPDGPITPDNLEPAVRPITVRHLLTHTAGLGYSIVQTGPLMSAYMEAGLVPAVMSRIQPPGLPPIIPAESLEVFADRLATMPLVHQPGTRWSYSVSMDLMGRVIEIAAGQTFDSFLEDRIFGPCGMSSTGFQVAAADVSRLTANYLLLGGVLLPIDLPENSIYLDPPAFPFGGAGLVSSPRDYDRFLMMLAGFGVIGGRRVMSEAAVRLGASDLFPDTLDAADAFAANYGHGAGGRAGKGAQAGTYGWFGAAGTCGLVDLTRGLRHSLYTQYMPAQAYPVQERFPDLVRQDTAARL